MENKTMADVKMVRVQRTIFDLASFEEVTLAKEVAFTPVESTQDALARLDGDAAKFLGIINEGLRAETRRVAAESPSDWHTLTEENEVNGAFDGIVSDIKKVNALVLTLAKTVFGYSKEMDKLAKAKAKTAAMDMIKSNDAIKSGLAASAALSPDTDE
jgi:hypothetical protein